jgi:hypothetical protein
MILSNLLSTVHHLRKTLVKETLYTRIQMPIRNLHSYRNKNQARKRKNKTKKVHKLCGLALKMKIKLKTRSLINHLSKKELKSRKRLLCNKEAKVQEALPQNQPINLRKKKYKPNLQRRIIKTRTKISS